MRKLLSTLSSTLQGGVRGGLLLLALVATTSLWAYDFQSGELYYNITSCSTAEVTSLYYYSGYDLTIITIPETVTHNGITYSVTSISGGAFARSSTLTSITIPNSITTIGYGAFIGCDGLTSPVYNAHCFAYMPTSFTGSYTIPDGIKQIAGVAFSDCQSLTSITIPNSVTTIGNGAFLGCSSLTSITLGNGVKNIEARAFYDTGIYNDESNWENDVLYIDNYLIKSKTISGRYTIKENTQLIADNAFEDCSYLISIALPNSVTSIGNYAFYNCRSLTSITIPNSVTSIGNEAFHGCSSLTAITIPNSVTNIGSGAFLGCDGLTSPVYNAHCFAYMPTSFTGSYTIPDGIKQIAGVAFSDCQSLTSITIPNSVISIGQQAFSNCSSLTSITIPNSITNIGGGMFHGCKSLRSIVLPEKIVALQSIQIGEAEYIGFFENCSSLTSITIPNSVTTIGVKAFAGCNSLTSVTIDSDAIIDKDYVGNDNIQNIFGSQVTEYIIGNNVTSIGDFSFCDCKSLTSITLGNNVTNIGDYAFLGCSALNIVRLQTIIPAILGEYVFSNVPAYICYIPCGSLENYEASAFKKYVSSFIENFSYTILLNASNDAFGHVTVLQEPDCNTPLIIEAIPEFGFSFSQWSDGVTENPRSLMVTQDTVLTAEFIAHTCGNNLYWNYNTITKTISITGSGDMYDYTADTQPWFLFKEEIKEVIIANTATSIGTSAFEGCIRLGKVSIGTAMVNIGANAFAGCTRLYHIYCYPTYPPFTDESSFANYNVYLHVPYNNKEEYDLDIVWGKFKFIECLSADEVEDTEDVEIDAGSTDVTITWPTEDGADTYIIVIKKDGEIVCTLTFNTEGQLLNIAFVPGRDGNHPAQYAEQAGNGYRFTVTGLEEGTDYTYDITVKDTSNKIIKSHSGEFTTQSTTAVDNITTNNANVQKIMRDGQFLILRDGVEYNAMGQEL